MAYLISPIPNQPVSDTHEWRDWFFRLGQNVNNGGVVRWDNIVFDGSTITSIQNRRHNDLQGLQGGSTSGTEYYHLSASEYSNIAVSNYGAFHFDFSTTLPGAITIGATTITVVDTTGFSTTGAIIIDKEVITYTGTTPTTFTGCTRGAYSSTAASHSSGAYVNGAQGTTANTSTLLQLNTTDLSSNVTLNTSTSEITVANSGVYNLQFSTQTFNFGAAADDFHIWFRLNGTDVDNSASIATTPAIHGGVPGALITAANIFLSLNAGDKIQLYWATTSGNTVLVTANPSNVAPVHPAAPAIIFTVNQIK